MESSVKKAESIDEYIAAFPKDVQEILGKIRAIIKNVAPEAVETMGYAIPSFRLHNTYLVHFAAFKNHIGFYPASAENDTFKKEFSNYKTGKGSVQFPLNQPMPYDLIKKVVEFRVKENLERVKNKVKKK